MAYEFSAIPNIYAEQAALNALRGPQVSPLQTLLQGAQQGLQLQQLPGQLRDQAAARQLNNALLQQRLLDVQDPNRVIARELNKQLALKSIDPASGIVRSIPGFEDQAIATPQAIDPTTQYLIDAGSDPTEFIGMRPPGAPITPIQGISGEATGFAQDYTIPRALEERKIEQSVNKLISEENIKSASRLKEIAARNDARGFKTWINTADPSDILNLNPSERPPEGFMDAKDYFRKGGPGAPSGAGGGGGLKPSAEASNQFVQGLGVLQQIDETLKMAEVLQKGGKFPNAMQVGLDEFLGRRPQDIPGAGTIPGIASAFATVQNLARGLQTKESAEIQRKKAIIGATIIRQQAGLSQTLGEAINIAPYTPSASDTYESLVGKLKDLRIEGARALKNQRRVFPALAAVPAPELGDEGATGQTQPASGGRSFPTEAQARAAGFKDGDFVIIGGRPGQLIPTTR